MLTKLRFLFWACAVCVAAGLSSCAKKDARQTLSEADSLEIVNDNLAHRREVEDFFRNSPNSPFARDTTITYEGIRWYPVNPHFRGQSVLHRYENPETVTVFGTKGEKRRNLRYGYFEFEVPDENGRFMPIRINVYKFTPHDKERFEKYKDHLSLWFTDKTTGKETYEVGRYIELGVQNPDPDHVYTIDLNKAFNPYCAYSDLYTCAIPLKDDHINVAIVAGEKKYHD